MILQLNHLNGKAAAATTQSVVDALYKLLEEGQIDHDQFSRFNVQLDWIQYKQNFREVVTSSRNGTGIDLRIDTRQVAPDSLHQQMVRAMGDDAAGSLPLEDFKSFRNSIAWEFNRLYWSYLGEWEKATGKGYEHALPGGKSDGNHEDAIADSVTEFWNLLRDMDTKHQLPAEIFILEIGVGTGKRCGMFVEKFRVLDHEHGTKYYPRLRVLMGDYSLATLDLSRPAVKEHIELCSFLALDALNPLKTLSFMRHKILYIHSTNMYDNLPDEEMLRRDGRLFYVHARACVPMAAAQKISEKFKIPVESIRAVVDKLLFLGPDAMGDRTCGMNFWMELWSAIRLEEKIVAIEDLPDLALPHGLDMIKLEGILDESPGDVRFHLSSGEIGRA